VGTSACSFIGTGRKIQRAPNTTNAWCFLFQNMIEDDKHKYTSRYCANCGYFYRVRHSCSDRFCADCMRRQYARLFSTYKLIAGNSRYLSLLTLTVRNFPDLRQGVIKKVLSDFKAFRSAPYVSRALRGGLAIIECKHVSDTRGWNLHIHVLLDSPYLAQAELQKIWYAISGDSFIVDIRKANSGDYALKYILKYLLKAPIVEGFDIDNLKSDYNSAFKGCRHVVSFGSFYNPELWVDDDYDNSCPKCGCPFWVGEEVVFPELVRYYGSSP